MPRANEVASAENWSHQSITITRDNDLAYIDEDVQQSHDHEKNESQLRNPPAMPSHISSQQSNSNCRGSQNATGNCANTHPMQTSVVAAHANDITIEQTNNSNGGSDSGTVKKPAIHQHSNDSESHSQQQQTQRLSNNISHNNKPEKGTNNARLNGCCCRPRRPASSIEECVDDVQADNYCQRSKNNNNNIKMTITLTKTTASPNGNSIKRGLLPADSLPAMVAATTTTTTAMTTLTATTTADAIEMASAPLTTSTTTSATTAAVLATTLSLSSTTAQGGMATNSTARRIMIGCSPDDISNESDGSYADCEEIVTQSDRLHSNCLVTIDNSTSSTACNDKCNNDTTMTGSAINTASSTQSASLSKPPSARSPSSSPPRATEAAIQAATTSQKATTQLPSQSQSQTSATVTSSLEAKTTMASATVSPVVSTAVSTGDKVLPGFGNKFESKVTAYSASSNTSNIDLKPCNGGDNDDNNDTSVTQNTRLNDKNHMCFSQRTDSKTNCDTMPRYIELEDLDEADDPYHVLQEYLERVENEINQVFELYKARRSDELDRCTDVDNTTVVKQMVADNKLPLNETSCRLSDSDDNAKAYETKSSSSNDRSSRGNSSGSGNQSDVNSSTSSLSKSGRYLRVPVTIGIPSEYRSLPTTPTIITSTNSVVGLNHSNGLIVPPPAPTRTSGSSIAALKRLNSQNDYLRTALSSPSSSPSECEGNGSGSGGNNGNNNSNSESIDCGSYDSNDDVNIWANKFLRELNNLMESDKWSTACSRTSMTNGNGDVAPKISIPQPKQHVVLPLQSFNLDQQRLAAATFAMRCLSPNGDSMYLKSPSAPNGNDSNHNPQSNCRFLPKNTPGSTMLKIAENDDDIAEKHRRQFKSDIKTIRSTTPQSQRQNQVTASAGPTAIPKRERVHHTATTHNLYLLHNDTTKKGSTSTIWTSEESILRSVGAVDEDNNSTSSSACEEASGVLSSGKSGISLDSSGLDNDNNESGIGTATPPKEPGFWKNNADNDSLTSSLDALRKIKFQKGSSVGSSDDPDLLEVLSLYDETHDDDDVDDMDIHHHNGEVDHDHEEFETGTFDDYDNIDCENNSGKAVVLRKKSNLQINDDDSQNGSRDASTHLLPYNYVQKSRSHSLEVSTLSPLPSSLRHELMIKNCKGNDRLHLTLRQEPFQSVLSSNFHELPSPSSASLHSGHESLGLQELTTKSNSAPLLLKKPRKWHRDDFGGQKQTLRYSRSQSDRHLAEIEAIEACKWLRAAGFPQYAQMYEDHQFPIDLTNVAKDHTNLENDPLQSLYRRLCILNRCANMRLDSSHKTHTPQKEDSDDENCALSENWTFQPHIRRWSRIGEMGLELPSKLSQDKTESSSKESSPDRYEDDDTYDISGANLNLSLPHEQTEEMAQTENDPTAVRLRRTGSERLKDGAKALLRRVESIKSRRRKRQNREGIVLSGPQMFDLSDLGQRSYRKPDAVYSTPPSPSAVSPMHIYPKTPLFHHPGHQNELKVPSQNDNFLSPNRISSPKRTPTTPRSMRTSPLHFFTAPPMPHLKEGKSDDSSSYYSDSQESSSTGGGKLTLSLRKTPSKSRRFLQRSGKVDDIGAHSDSECHQGRKFVFKDAKPTEMKVKKLTRGGSLNLGKDPKKREGFRSASFRTRSTVRKDHKNSESDTEQLKVSKSPVVRWHSFQEEERPHMIFKKCLSRKGEADKTEGTPFAAMSCGQLQIIRKLALVILTGYMERYCPTHRSGWNWELPKFIKKIKMPDYKDKKVFGVPLLLILQRTGQTLPVAVKAAFRWLQLNALDQIGLFRKSGVKSRISKLKERIELAESSVDCMDVFDTQQAYDVADMLKQYFRDLPESLLTTKMSETFAAIFQHLPPDVRLDAVQCAVLLLPDENRETLYALLEFLTLVADNSQYNQMTANNLAVCLAPSLFHNSISTGNTSVASSPRRRKTTGVPDVKELSEAKASHECLSFMIDNYKQIFTASRERISKCNFGYMEESKPVPLEALGEGMQFHNWRGYLYECTSATIKEGREKSRGWITITSLDPNVDIAYKKVGDGHPLRLWRCTTEVEGPPRDVVEYVLKQRASWDHSLLHSQTIQKLDERTELFQYAIDGQVCTDFCVLRSWQTDLPRGACVIVETSIDHPKARPIFVSVRGVVLASRYLIEPCGSGRSRVMHLARVDIKGKTPEWYNKSYGHISSQYLSRIRTAFKHVADVPESKV